MKNTMLNMEVLDEKLRRQLVSMKTYHMGHPVHFVEQGSNTPRLNRPWKLRQKGNRQKELHSSERNIERQKAELKHQSYISCVWTDDN